MIVKRKTVGKLALIVAEAVNHSLILCIALIHTGCSILDGILDVYRNLDHSEMFCWLVI